MKMIAIGLGKQKGADTFHRQGYATFARADPGGRPRTRSPTRPIPFGLALVENGHARLGTSRRSRPDRIAEREAELLADARAAHGPPAAGRDRRARRST